jgi:hypothetical protein
MKKTLEPKINQNVKYDYDHPAVKASLKLISKNIDAKNARDSKNKIIKELFKAGFTIATPDGLKKIHSKMLVQAVMKFIGRMKPLDAQIHGTGVPQWMEDIVTDAVRTVADMGDFDNALRDKMGAFWNSILYGDAFTLMMSNTKGKGIPFYFDTLDNSKVYFNTKAVKFRGGRGNGVSQLLIIMPFTWAEAVKQYPKLAKIGGAGKFPASLDLSSGNYSDNNEINDDDTVEIGYFFDIENDCYSIMAGSAMTVLEEYWEDNYPFKLNDESYIPVMHHLCFPGVEDFSNQGIGDYVYELAIITQQLLNMGTVGALNEALPLDIVNIPQAKASDFFNQMLEADEMRLQGKRPYVAIEYDPNDPNASTISSQTLQTQYGTRWAQLIEMIEGELLKMGINLREADYKPNATATEILAVEQAQSQTIKQVMEFNASEYQFFYNVILNHIQNFVDFDDETPINLSVMPYAEDGTPINAEGLTLGAIAKELNQNNYFVKVNSRSGAIPSGVMQQAQIVNQLQSTPPGTRAHFMLLKDFSKLNDRDFSLEDFGYQAQQAQMPQRGAEVPEGVMVTGTERESINPYSSKREPAMM